MLLRFIRALDRALLGCDLLALLPSPADVRLGPRTLVQPDLFVFRKDSGRHVCEWSEVGVPVLAIEFLSPSAYFGPCRTPVSADVGQRFRSISDTRFARCRTPEPGRGAG